MRRNRFFAVKASCMIASLTILSACGSSPKTSDGTSALQQLPTSNGNQSQDSLASELTFVSHMHDFGQFSYTDTPVISHYFVFTNTGNAPLVINNASVSCNCTKVEYPQEPVMPGMSDSIKVSFNGDGMPFEVFRKTVTIQDNTAEASHLIIIMGEMTE